MLKLVGDCDYMAQDIPKLLQEAHRLRKFIRDLKAEIALEPRIKKVQEDDLTKAEKGYKESFVILEKLKVKLRTDESSLRSLVQQMQKFEKQLDDASSPKEYEGKQSEIRQAKEKVATMEESILQTMEEIESRTQAIPEVEKQWAEAQSRFQQLRQEAEEQQEQLRAHLLQAEQDLGNIDASIPQEILADYQRLVKQYGPDGLASVAGKTCGHCRMAITEQQKINLNAGRFVCCSSCGRALYPI